MSQRHREFRLEIEGFPILGEAYLPSGRGHPLAILCHGLPAGQPDPTDPGYPFLAQRLAEAGFATLFFNFRGTGKSGGNLDMMGWARDLMAVIDYALRWKGMDFSRLALVGFSAGAVASVYVVAQEPRVGAVVALGCPAQFEEKDIPALLEHCRKEKLIRDPAFPPSVAEWGEGFLELSPLRWVAHLSPRPLLLIHGDQDEQIPLRAAQALYQKAGEPRELVIIPGAGHRLRREERAVVTALEWLKNWAKAL